MKKVLLSFLLTLLSDSSFCQNTTSKYTRPITNIAATVSPGNGFFFENNLMNHINDDMRIDNEEIGLKISCDGAEDGTILHSSKRGIGNRNLIINCHDKAILERIQDLVSQKYSKGMGENLKYAVVQGSYIYGVCNYDEKHDHKSHSHHNGHYACRTPIENLSKHNNAETYCFNMTWFHKTCNPHKALVATELILANSIHRWDKLDKTFLLDSLKNHLKDKDYITILIEDLSNSQVIYNNRKKGSPLANKRYPKLILGSHYYCVEELLKSDDLYVNTSLACKDISKLSWQEHRNITQESILKKPLFKINLTRLKQTQKTYPLLDGMDSYY